MKIKKSFYIFLTVFILLNITGCQLALEDKGESNKDRLIGVFITKEYLDLFDMEAYLNDNINKMSGGGLIDSDANNGQYQGRLYATLATQTLKDDTGKTYYTREFVFDSIEGITYFSAMVPATENEESFTTSGSDEAICDGHIGIHHGDDEDKTTLEGTIYVSSGYINNVCYINPVYQNADGSVYAISGNGFMVSGEQGEGSVYSQTLEEKTTITENGKSKSASISIKISLSMIIPPEQIFIMQMDKDNHVISQREYKPGNLPDALTPEAGTEYIIVETHKRDTESNLTASRSIYDRSNEVLDTFYCRNDGICVKQWTNLEWHKN